MLWNISECFEQMVHFFLKLFGCCLICLYLLECLGVFGSLENFKELFRTPDRAKKTSKKHGQSLLDHLIYLVAHLNKWLSRQLAIWSHHGMLSRPCLLPCLNGTDLLLIVDGMDQGKFAFPRHRALKAKEFANFQRPRAHVIGCILHGRGILFAVTDPDLPKDASTHIELVAHALTWLTSFGVTLSELSVALQCDNTPRECKNNVMLSFIASLVARGFLRGVGFHF